GPVRPRSPSWRRVDERERLAGPRRCCRTVDPGTLKSPGRTTERQVMNRVLLVEDNKLNQVVAGSTLQKLGYTVEIVDGGAAAVAASRATRFDAILMDVMMPEMDGYETTAAIREAELADG